MPTYFYQSMSTFFDNIFNAIYDPKPAIRESAGEALRAALIVTSQRENTKQSSKPQWYMICYEEAIKCFTSDLYLKEKGITKDDRIHGGLIILNELFRCSNSLWEKRYNTLKNLQIEQKKNFYINTDGNIGGNNSLTSSSTSNFVPRLKAPFIEKIGKSHHSTTTSSTSSTSTPLYYLDNDHQTLLKFSVQNIVESANSRQILIDHYQEICDKVLEQRQTRSPHIQQGLLTILPRMAAFNREIFSKKYLNLSINYLLMTLKGKEKDRNIAYITIGYIAVAVEKDIDRHLKNIMDAIKIALPSKDTPSKKKPTIDPTIFTCITLLGHAVKSGITEDIKEILESMFSTGLSPALTVCFRELAENVPHVKRRISDGLINMLSQVLMNKTIPTLGTPKHNLSVPFSALTTTSSDTHQYDVQTIVLALKTLGSFNFEDQSMLEFVQR